MKESLSSLLLNVETELPRCGDKSELSTEMRLHAAWWNLGIFLKYQAFGSFCWRNGSQPHYWGNAWPRPGLRLRSFCVLWCLKTKVAVIKLSNCVKTGSLRVHWSPSENKCKTMSGDRSHSLSMAHLGPCIARPLPVPRTDLIWLDQSIPYFTKYAFCKTLISSWKFLGFLCCSFETALEYFI